MVVGVGAVPAAVEDPVAVDPEAVPAGVGSRRNRPRHHRHPDLPRMANLPTQMVARVEMEMAVHQHRHKFRKCWLLSVRFKP